MASIVAAILPLGRDFLISRQELKRAIDADIATATNELLPKAIEQLQSARADSNEDVSRIKELCKLVYEIEVNIDLYNIKKSPLRSLTEFADWLKNSLSSLKAAQERVGQITTPSASEEPEDLGVLLARDITAATRSIHYLEAVHNPNDPLNDLIELLRPSENQSQEKLRVISIVGPGGVGKTHLSGRIVMNLNLEGSYDVVAFIHAADKADENILRELLSTIPPRDEADTTTTYSTEDLQGRLKQKLTAGRYLVVIDDVQKKQQWANIKSAFPADCPQNRRSRVIVTTTIQSVADACIIPDGYVYKMRTLDDTASRSLFTTKLVALNRDTEVVELFAKGLIDKCEGLPLALVSTAQLVRERNQLQSCEDICRNLGGCLETENTLEKMQCMLARMYSTLEDSLLKSCLLYFCTLKFSYPISRNSIIRQWIAEGFVDAEHRSKGPLLTEQYKKLEILMDRNIIGHTDVSNNGKVKRCRPSGMVHEYISYKSEVEKFVASTPSDTCIRRLPLHGNTKILFRGFGKSYPRTLVISEGAADSILSFPKCELVQVLDLENCSNLVNDHLKRICDLLLLKYLSLGRQVTRLPRKIAKLQLLETLDLGKTGVKELPLEVIRLPNLRHLLGKFQLRQGDYNKRTGDWLKKKSILETLAGFITTRNRGFPQLMRHMKRLQKVKIWIKSDADDKNLSDLSQAIKEYVSGSTDELAGKRSLSIDFEAELPPSFLMDRESSPVNGSSRTSVNGSLDSLKLCGPREQLSQILRCFTKVKAIKELCLSSTTTFIWDADVLGNMNVLLYLKLEAVQAGGIHIIINPDTFNALSRMCLSVMGNLPQITIEDGAMKSLHSLHLICTDLDAALAAQIQRLPRIREVRLHCPTVTEATKEAWRNVERGHPNKPNVLLVVDPPPARLDESAVTTIQ